MLRHSRATLGKERVLLDDRSLVEILAPLDALLDSLRTVGTFAGLLATYYTVVHLFITSFGSGLSSNFTEMHVNSEAPKCGKAQEGRAYSLL